MIAAAFKRYVFFPIYLRTLSTEDIKNFLYTIDQISEERLEAIGEADRMKWIKLAAAKELVRRGVIFW